VKRKFLIRLILFATPLLILFGFPAMVLFRSGELASLDEVIRIQRTLSRVAIFGSISGELAIPYKVKSTIQIHPRVVALGTSRVMSFRSAFFSEGVTFFNAGGAIRSAANLTEFLRMIPRGGEPDLILFGCEQYFFNVKSDPCRDERYAHDARERMDYATLVREGTRRIYSGLFINHKYSFSQVSEILFHPADSPREESSHHRDPIRIGINAALSNHGFLNDGSVYWGEHFLDREFADAFSRIRRQNHRFEPGEDISPEALSQIDSFLKECHDRGIIVIGFLPPYPNVIFRKMLECGNYRYLEKIYPIAGPLFRTYGFELHDFSDLSTLNAPDSEAYDGYHASEKAYVRLLLALIERCPNLRKYASPDVLKQRLADSKNPLTVFEIGDF
jgi:hypothetical protein